MRRSLVAALLVFSAFAPGISPANHPEEDPNVCRGSIGGMYIRHSSQPQVQVPVLADGVIIPITDPATGPFYLDVRDIASAYWNLGIWLYVESNGRRGLQRGGCPIAPNTPGTAVCPESCNESATPDQYVF